MRATVNAVNLRCIAIFLKALSFICAAKIPRNRRSLPASQLICAWMMSFEDHLLLLALAVFSTVISIIVIRVNWPMYLSIHGLLPGNVDVRAINVSVAFSMIC